MGTNLNLSSSVKGFRAIDSFTAISESWESAKSSLELLPSLEADLEVAGELFVMGLSW